MNWFRLPEGQLHLLRAFLVVLRVHAVLGLVQRGEALLACGLKSALSQLGLMGVVFAGIQVFDQFLIMPIDYNLILVVFDFQLLYLSIVILDLVEVHLVSWPLVIVGSSGARRRRQVGELRLQLGVVLRVLATHGGQVLLGVVRIIRCTLRLLD